MLSREDGQRWEIAAWMDEAGYKSDLYGNGQGHEHDRNSGGRVHRSQGLGRPRGRVTLTLSRTNSAARA
jgi:hypothetical protein